MSEETVQAVSNAAKEIAATGGKAIDFTSKLAGYFDGMLRELGNAAENTMAGFRLRNWIKVRNKTIKLLEENGFELSERKLPPKFALPFVTYATLEEDEELQDIWAQMLANAVGTSSDIELRTSYIDILKDLTAFDIKNLSPLAKLSMSDFPQEFPPLIHTEKLPDSAEVSTTMSEPPKRPTDEVLLSLSNLSRAGCISPTFGFGGMPLYSQVCVTALGMGLYRACTKPRN